MPDRFRLKGLIGRIEHTNPYKLTPEGIRVDLFFTKLHDRLPGALLAVPSTRSRRAPPRPRQVNQSIDHIVTRARIKRAA